MAMVATSADPIADGIAFAHAQVAGLDPAEMINFALGLEHLEAAVYAEAIASGAFGDKALTVLGSIQAQAMAHVAALSSVVVQLGATPAAPREYYPVESLSSARVILATIERMELGGLGACIGAIGLSGAANRARVIAAAGDIERAKARHYAQILLLQDAKPARISMGTGYTVPRIHAAIAPDSGMRMPH